MANQKPGRRQYRLDCLIVTQTFQLIYDIKSAIANCYAALKPGGVLLATSLASFALNVAKILSHFFRPQFKSFAFKPSLAPKPA